jgi:ABC-type sugar transport system substrate-binding protein
MGLKDKVWVVGHDIYPEMVKYLENGPILATVFQNPILTGRIGFDLLLNYILGNRVKQGEMIIHPELVLKSNLECYKEYM